MIDQAITDKMQGNREASFGCLKANASQGSGNSIEGFPEPKDEKVNYSGDSIKSGNPMIWEASPPPNQGYPRPFYRQEILTWPYIYPDYQVLRQSQPHAVENHFYHMNRDYSFPVENRIQYVPYKLFSQDYPHDVQLQEFQYFVVIDFEATCDKDTNPHPQEIIEFPSVLVNSVTGQLEASFQTYVRPAYHQLLTDFCKELTGIQQIQVDRGVSLSEALLMHDKWLEDKGIKHKNFAVVTWSNWDCRVMLESECRFKRIRKPPYFNRWINLKVPFQEVFGGMRCNLKEAVQLAGLAWEGRAHCGLDDARNTARLLALLMHRGFKFSITNSLMTDPSIRPLTTHQPIPDRPSDPNHYQTLKPKDLVAPPVQFHPLMDPVGKDRHMYCFCGVLSSRCVVRKPGPTQGRCFFGCGNWTTARRALCNYFVWASP
ncbi:ERI1 exoribonuclease 2 [Ananas comosus]|uniref:ERI1 exoribonuclease 2 n=1 Tax=Ananas comosus TaxID=4615 RepID=A0A199UND0_ANACO|nr:ERI1 exoribonuclease 2 [Ananas comosus]